MRNGVNRIRNEILQIEEFLQKYKEKNHYTKKKKYRLLEQEIKNKIEKKKDKKS